MAITKAYTSSIKTLNNLKNVKYDIVSAGNNKESQYFFQFIPPQLGGGTGFAIYGRPKFDSSNNIYVFGVITTAANPSYNVDAILKISSTGNLLNAWTYNPNNASVGSACYGRVDSSGNIYLASGRTGTSDGGRIALAKFSQTPTLSWNKKIANTSKTMNDIAMDWSESTGYCAVAWDISDGNGYIYAQPRVGLVDQNGVALNNNLASYQSYSTQDGYMYDVVSMPARLGNTAGIGWVTRRYNGRYGVNVCYAQSYNANFTYTWDREILNSNTSGNNQVGVYKINCDSSSNVYLAGYYQDDASVSVYNGWLVKLDTSGTIVWSKRIYWGTASWYTQGTDVAIDSSGNCYLICTTKKSATDGTGAISISKWNSAGTIQWQRILGTTNNCGIYGNRINLDGNGDLIITGAFYSQSSYNPDYGTRMVIKLPADGSKTGTYTWYGPNGTYTFDYSTSSMTTGNATTTNVSNNLGFYNTSSETVSADSSAAVGTAPYVYGYQVVNA